MPMITLPRRPSDGASGPEYRLTVVTVLAALALANASAIAWLVAAGSPCVAERFFWALG